MRWSCPTPPPRFAAAVQPHHGTVRYGTLSVFCILYIRDWTGLTNKGKGKLQKHCTARLTPGFTRTWTLTLSTTRGAWLSDISLLGLFLGRVSLSPPSPPLSPFPPTPSTSYRLVSQSQPYKANNLRTSSPDGDSERSKSAGQTPRPVAFGDIGCQLELVRRDLRLPKPDEYPRCGCPLPSDGPTLGGGDVDTAPFLSSRVNQSPTGTYPSRQRRPRASRAEPPP